MGLGSVTDILVTVGRWPVLLAVLAAVLGPDLPLRTQPPSGALALDRLGRGRGRDRLGADLGRLLVLRRPFRQLQTRPYGSSLGAVIGFMTWIWISSMVILLGAELDAELEQQTAIDTTTGPPRPKGSRGAVRADT